MISSMILGYSIFRGSTEDLIESHVVQKGEFGSEGKVAKVS